MDELGPATVDPAVSKDLGSLSRNPDGLGAEILSSHSQELRRLKDIASGYTKEKAH